MVALGVPEYKNLTEMIEQSFRRLSDQREERSRLIRIYANEETPDIPKSVDPQYRKAPLNLMCQTAEAYMMALAANRPRVLITSNDLSRASFAFTFQTAINNYLKLLRAEEVFRACVLDAFFGAGIVKVCYTNDVVVEYFQDFTADVGRPMLNRISFDNWFYDTDARRLSQCKFMGDVYQIPIKTILDDPDYYDAVIARKLTGDRVPMRAANGEDQAHEISVESDPESANQAPFVMLADVFLPYEGLMLTIPWSHKEMGPLHTERWTGPKNGPYRVLGLGAVPDNIQAVNPAANLEILQDVANDLLRKGIKQAQREANWTAIGPSALADGDKIRKVRDGEVIPVKNPKDIQEMRIGGVDGPTAAFQIGVMDMFDRMAGNLQTMAGLGPMAGTARQEGMIGEQVSKREAYMQAAVVDFIRGTITDLAHLLWNHQGLEIPGIRDIPELGIKIPDPWTPDMRSGDFLDYDFDIDIYSLPHKTPSQRLAAIQSAVDRYTQLYAMGALQQVGGEINFQRLLEIESELIGEPRLREIIRFAGKSQSAADMAYQGGSGRMLQSPKTERTYIRKNIPTGGTDAARRGVLQQALLTGSPQINQQQGAMMTR